VCAHKIFLLHVGSLQSAPDTFHRKELCAECLRTRSQLPCERSNLDTSHSADVHSNLPLTQPEYPIQRGCGLMLCVPIYIGWYLAAAINCFAAFRGSVNLGAIAPPSPSLRGLHDAALHKATELSDEQFSCAVQLRLSLPVLPYAPSVCPLCNIHIAGIACDAIGCAMMQRTALIRRHDLPSPTGTACGRRAMSRS